MKLTLAAAIILTSTIALADKPKLPRNPNVKSEITVLGNVGDKVYSLLGEGEVITVPFRFYQKTYAVGIAHRDQVVFYGGLEKSSIRLKPGTRLAQGEPIGELGKNYNKSFLKIQIRKETLEEFRKKELYTTAAEEVDTNENTKDFEAIYKALDVEEKDLNQGRVGSNRVGKTVGTFECIKSNVVAPPFTEVVKCNENVEAAALIYRALKVNARHINEGALGAVVMEKSVGGLS